MKLRPATILSAAALLATVPLIAPDASATTSECELVQLRTAPGSPWGTVTDIEVVGGEAAYYGSYDQPDEDGVLHQRAVVWFGEDAEPVEVGPSGYDSSVAFDLTATGLVNGIAQDWSSGVEVSWVQDLDTGAVTLFDTSVGPRTDVTGPGFVRRINDAGAAAGTVDQGDGWARAGRAVAYDAGRPEPRVLESRGHWSWAMGINNRGDRVGVTEHRRLVGDGRWSVWDPTVWTDAGTAHRLPTPGIEGQPRVVNDTGNVAGGLWMGDTRSGHVEAGFWPSYDTVAVGLGLLSGGAWSEALGLDEGGLVVGGADVVPEEPGPLTDPWSGSDLYNFTWTEDLGSGQVRVLPSLYGQAGDDWHDWYATHAAHAANTELDQAGAGTHSGFTDGTPVGAPTVFKNVSRCGVVVDTVLTTPYPQSLEESHAARRAPGPLS